MKSNRAKHKQSNPSFQPGVSVLIIKKVGTHLSLILHRRKYFVSRLIRGSISFLDPPSSDTVLVASADVLISPPSFISTHDLNILASVELPITFLGPAPFSSAASEPGPASSVDGNPITELSIKSSKTSRTRAI